MSNNAENPNDPIQVYLKELQRLPLLDRAEELDCIGHILAGDEMAESARTRLLEGSLLLVFTIARRYENGPVHLLDLIQRGNEGLLRTVENLASCERDQFGSHAASYIERAIAEAAASSNPTTG